MKHNNLAIEYEATFCDIDVDSLRDNIQILWGNLIKPLFPQKRTVFHFPQWHEIAGWWLRVRDENNKITMSLKIMQWNGLIEGQKEIELVVDNYENPIALLKTMWAREKAVQETKREIWQLDGVQLMIDRRPFLEPIVEIEWESELKVQQVAIKLWFHRNDAIFDSIDYIYSKKYNISKDRVNNHTPRIVFDMNNPFVTN